MHILSPTYLTFLFLYLPTLIAALPGLLVERHAPAPNISHLVCFPAGPDTPLPPIPMDNCRFALQSFLSAHNSTGPRPHTVTFTTNRTAAALNPTQYVLTPIETAPRNEPVAVGPECGLAFAVYYGRAPLNQRPDVSVRLSALRNATEEVILGCTGGKEVGNGGAVVLTTPEGMEIDITVQRPV